ncbi:MAG TPA: glycosyltransferase family 4 protein [Bacteroidales bacterium]|nr:glycosyltransferase family 4 protein [Bacteroidales bacterium]HSA43722.1 glycosyltransferase family 4 protein [Bacteroidales bacterium]
MPEHKAFRKIIYISPVDSGFIKNDLALLGKSYRLVSQLFPWRNPLTLPLNLLRQILMLCLEIRGTKAIFVSFAGYWAILPGLFGRLTGKPVFLILHGTECASIPSVPYGSLRKKMSRAACRLSMHLATRLLPVSESLVYMENSFYDSGKPEEIRQGYKHFFPHLKTPYTVIGNGLNTMFWEKLPDIRKEDNTFIAVIGQGQFVLKGGDLILQVAGDFPDCLFHIVGCSPPSGPLPGNVIFTGRLTMEELKQQYSRCRFHMQLSIFEGFGLALCEAMSCECIPIVSAVNILPEIAGDTGFVLGKRDTALLREVIVRALSLENKEEAGRKARARIVERYPLDKRGHALTALPEIRDSAQKGSRSSCPGMPEGKQ